MFTFGDGLAEPSSEKYIQTTNHSQLSMHSNSLVRSRFIYPSLSTAYAIRPHSSYCSVLLVFSSSSLLSPSPRSERRRPFFIYQLFSILQQNSKHNTFTWRRRERRRVSLFCLVDRRNIYIYIYYRLLPAGKKLWNSNRIGAPGKSSSNCVVREFR